MFHSLKPLSTRSNDVIRVIGKKNCQNMQLSPQLIFLNEKCMNLR